MTCEDCYCINVCRTKEKYEKLENIQDKCLYFLYKYKPFQFKINDSFNIYSIESGYISHGLLSRYKCLFTSKDGQYEFDSDELGKNYFFSKEEAEKALMERSNK